MRRFNAMTRQFVHYKIAELVAADLAHYRYATVQPAQVDSGVRGAASHTHPKPVCGLQFSFPGKGINGTGEYICDQDSKTGHIHKGRLHRQLIYQFPQRSCLLL
jgi:hypothetical protein